jgi:hypothetical protein
MNHLAPVIASHARHDDRHRAARPGVNGLMVYSFARIRAAIGMRVENVYTHNSGLWVRLRQKGGKRHAMPL